MTKDPGLLRKLFAAFVLSAVVQAPALASIVRVTAQNAVIYEYKDGKMTPVARAPQGYRLTVADPAKGAWYAMSWPNPAGGTKTVWIPVRDVEVTEAGPAQSSTAQGAAHAASKRSGPAAAYRRWYLQAGLNGVYMNPSNLQDSAGFVRNYQISYQWSGEAGFLPHPSISTGLRFDYLSVAAVSSDGTNLNYSVTAPVISLTGDYLFINNGRMRLGLGLQIGAAISRVSVQDSTGVPTASTFTGVDGAPRLVFKYMPTDVFGFYVEANYRVLFPLAAVPLTSTFLLSTDLNGPGFGLGATVAF